MKKHNKIIWGVILVCIGILLTLNALDVFEINFFSDGWWTLFIIIPNAVELFTKKEKFSSFVGLSIGVVLLLCCKEIIDFVLVWKLLIPATVLIIGLRLLTNGIFGNKSNVLLKNAKKDGNTSRVGCGALSGCNMDCSGEIFQGAELTAAFGGVKCDLRNAIIEEDCGIQVSAIFGGIEILVPENVNVKVNTNSLFGVVSDETKRKDNSPTLYIGGICMFGGVKIK